MASIPIDIVNHICEFAAGRDKVWYPFFSPKTLKVSWKMNRYCSKINQLARNILINEIEFVILTFYNYYTGEQRNFQCRMINFKQTNRLILMYIEFNLDNDMIRTMITIDTSYLFGLQKRDILYLNETPYADVITCLRYPWGGIFMQYKTY